MNNTKLKFTAIVLGIFSLFYSIISFSGVATLFRVDGDFDVRMITGHPIFLLLRFSGLLTVGLFIASFGLYKGKKWGYLLSNVCLGLFLVDFAVIVIQHFYPDFLDSTIKSESGWFIFYHFNLNFETLTAPIIALLFIIFLNLKSVRRHYY